MHYADCNFKWDFKTIHSQIQFSCKSGEQIPQWMSQKVVLLISPVLKGDTGRRMNYLSVQQWFYKFNLGKKATQSLLIVSDIWKSFVCLVRSAFSAFILHCPWYGQFVLSGSSFYPGQMCCRSLWNFMLLLNISIMLCCL